MNKNMSNIDRLIRLIVAAVVVGLWVSGTLTGTWLTIGLIVAAIFVVTSAIGFCPLYRLFGKTFGTKRPASPMTPPATPQA